MIEIFLNHGYVALVDDDDYHLVSRIKWSFVKVRPPKQVYARGLDKSTGKLVYMHRLIMGVTSRGIHIDHINGNTLDNRRENLRECTITENNRNRGKMKGSNTFKGVLKRFNKWAAAIKVDNKSIRLGSFHTEREAAIAYNEAALRYHGEFANLNEV